MNAFVAGVAVMLGVSTIAALLICPGMAKSRQQQSVAVACNGMNDDSGDRIMPLWKLLAVAHEGILVCQTAPLPLRISEQSWIALLRYGVTLLPDGFNPELSVQSAGEDDAAISFQTSHRSNGHNSKYYIVMRPSFLHDFHLEVYGDGSADAVVKRDYSTALRQMVNIDQFFRGEQ